MSLKVINFLCIVIRLGEEGTQSGKCQNKRGS